MKTNIFKSLIALGAIALFVSSCEDKETAIADTEPHGIILANMDTLVSPKDDFYNYVNGTWMKETKIPEDRSSWGGFSVLRKSTDKDVLEIIAKAKDGGTYGPETDQAKALFIFDTKMDMEARNALGMAPLQPALDAIAGIQNLADLQTVIASVPSVGTPFFGIGASADYNDSSMNAAYLWNNGLGLPDRDYYLDEDEKSKEIRA